MLLVAARCTNLRIVADAWQVTGWPHRNGSNNKQHPVSMARKNITEQSRPGLTNIDPSPLSATRTPGKGMLAPCGDGPWFAWCFWQRYWGIARELKSSPCLHSDRSSVRESSLVAIVWVANQMLHDASASSSQDQVQARNPLLLLLSLLLPCAIGQSRVNRQEKKQTTIKSTEGWERVLDLSFLWNYSMICQSLPFRPQAL